MEQARALPICQHPDCEFDQREEYCSVEASKPDGLSGIVIELVEQVLYRVQGTSSENLYVSSQIDEFLMQRTVSYLAGDVKTFIWPLISHELAITHTFDRRLKRDRYDIRVGWRVHQLSIAPNRGLPTTYSLERYPQGAVQASVEDIDVTTGLSANRPMTNYDMTQLFDILNMLETVQLAEQKDNASAVPYLSDE